MTVQLGAELTVHGTHNVSGPVLCAILLNPSPKGCDSVSHGNLRIAAEALGFKRASTVNLVQVQSRNSRDLADLAIDRATWHSARTAIDDALRACDHVLFGWGDSPLRGIANTWKQEQIDWTIRQAIDHGHEHILMLDRAPRHPSRWRQYVGPQRGLFDGSSLSHRFAQALQFYRTDSVLANRGNPERSFSVKLLDRAAGGRPVRERNSA